MKKFLLMSVACFLALAGRAQEVTPGESSLDFEADGIWYTILNDDTKTCQTKAGSSYIDYTQRTLVTTYGNSNTGDVNIPATVVKQGDVPETYTVVGIGEYGFDKLSSITIADGVSSIGLSAFTMARSLTSVSLPSSITEIGAYAFSGCAALTTINLPEGITAINNNTFVNCSLLNNVTIPSSVVTIGDNAFSQCDALTSIIIPDNVQQIGKNCFYSCSSLAEITLSQNLTMIPASAFSGTAISSITLPASISSIAENAFANCQALNEVTSLSIAVPAISYSSFSSSTLAGTLKVYKSALSAYQKSPLWGAFSNIELIQVPATGISLFKTALNLSVGTYGQLNAIIEPAEATTEVTWSYTSVPEGAVTVSETGRVTGQRIGTATVTATCGTYTATCQVNISANPSERVTVNPVGNIYVGDEVTLSAMVFPASITAPITWSSSNPEIATIDASTGRLNAIAEGGVVITADCDGVTGQLAITILGVAPQSVTLNNTSLTLKPGQTSTLTATVAPDNTSDKTVTWETSDPTVATVVEGTVTAVGVGSCTIRAKCGEVMANCEVTVEPIAVESITLSANEITLKASQTQHLTVTVNPSDATDQTITWVSDNESVAMVTVDGFVTAISVGSANITATCGNATASCAVTVEPTLATEVVINYTALTMRAEQTQQLTASVDASVTDKTITWSTSDAGVATVSDNGLVTAIAVGSATITAANGNVSATCEITVEPTPAEQILLDTAAATVNVNENVTLTATVNPSNTTDPTVTWTSDNESIATVTNGEVTGVAPGTTTIRATCGSVSATCVITVLQPATSVTLNETTLDMFVGDLEDLIAIVNPENTTDILTWSSSDTSVASVNEHGIVEALGAGTATITATCGNAKAECTVTVSAVMASEVTLNYTELTLKETQSQQLIATVAPDNTTDKTITWASSDTSVATVTADGTVTAVAEGSANVTATCGTVSATCVVTVEKPAPTELVINYTEYTLQAENSIQLSVTLDGNEVTADSWTSSDSKVASVSSDGLVTALAVGTTTITATYGDVTATCLITVEVTPAEQVVLNYTEITLEPDESFTLVAEVLPSTATDTTVVWSSDNEDVATVDQNGNVTAVGEGFAVITALCGDVYAQCVVTVAVDTETGVEVIETEQPEVDTYRVYDMKGMVVLVTSDKNDLKQLANGLYIINGKKVVIRH